MKQWVTNQDGIENLKMVISSMPDEAELKKGEVLVRINRVSLNYRDTEGIPRLSPRRVFYFPHPHPVTYLI
jgi:NADPH:quinone reductase-like Zn-dependent oxidoreductase